MSRARLNADHYAGSTDASALDSGTLATARMASGTILRSFYNESDAALQTFAVGDTYWDELELTITGGGSASDFLQVTVGLYGLHNKDVDGQFWIGVAYAATGGGSWSSPTQFGTRDFYTRTNFTNADAYDDAGGGGRAALNVDSMITVRFAHPSTSTYYIRPIIKIVLSAQDINKGGDRSTISAFEIKG